MEKVYRPGIDASRRVRSAKALAHLETMRKDYIAIVRERLADPRIPAEKKLSFYAIAKCLTALGHEPPKSGPITYKIARRLSEIVGEVTPLPEQQLIEKPVGELQVGDCVEVIARWRPEFGSVGIVRRILNGGEGFGIEVDGRGRKLRPFLPEEIKHQPDERHFYDPLSLAEG